MVYTEGSMDWQQAYAAGETPWDLRAITPPLRALLASGVLTQLGMPASARVLVPGCGRGHDLRAWATAGHRVTGIDITPEVVAEARALLAWNRAPHVAVLCRDLLGIGGEFEGGFDVAYDYTCFCALPPHLRASYAREMAAVLEPGGLWVGLVFPMRPHPRPDGAAGPPYLVRVEDLRAAFVDRFEPVVDLDAEFSVPQRAGKERWYVWRRV